MDGAALQMIEEHFGQFGETYAQAFLAAVPEPTCHGIAGMVGSLSMLRRRRNTLE